MPIPAQRRSPRSSGGADIVVETAWLYYHDGLNQNEIAARLDVSRASVVNYLQEARERGLVQVRLAAEAFTGHEAALRLRAAFGLDAAYVLPDGATAAETEARVCRGAADWLPRLVAPGDRLGIAWGKTIYDVGEYLEPHAVADMTVLQLVGSMATPYGFSADVCSSNVARKFSARCVNLHVPAVLSDAKIAGLLRQEALIARQLEDVSRPTKTAFATGSCTPDSHVVSSGVASLDDLDRYLARGAVGVLCGRFIDAAGDPVPGPLDARMMGVELDRLRRPEVGLLVCPAAERVTATVAALRGGYATHVVTHVEAAEAMLAQA